MPTPIHTRTAAELAAAVASGDLTAREAVEAHLERIAAVNPAVNAVTTPLADRARAEAAQVDRRRAAGERLGPLAGVPFTVKENIHVAGTATTFGVPRLGTWSPARTLPRCGGCAPPGPCASAARTCPT